MGIFNNLKNKIKSGQAPAKKEKVAEKESNKEIGKKYTTLKEKGSEASSLKVEKEKKVKKDETKDAYKILIKPLVTEKATDLVAQNKYSFAVALSANKIEVKKAIKSLYGFEPIQVNIIKMGGKFVRTGRTLGKKKNWKKAIVTLKAGEKIQLYEGV